MDRFLRTIGICSNFILGGGVGVIYYYYYFFYKLPILYYVCSMKRVITRGFKQRSGSAPSPTPLDCTTIPPSTIHAMQSNIVYTVHFLKGLYLTHIAETNLPINMCINDISCCWEPFTASHYPFCISARISPRSSLLCGNIWIEWFLSIPLHRL